MFLLARHSGSERIQRTRPCGHHWLIEAPKGQATSRGICKGCGAVRRFANATGDADGRFLARPPTPVEKRE